MKLDPLENCETRYMEFLDTWIDVYYDYYPGEEEVHRTPNGDGSPKVPPYVELQAVYIGDEDITDITEIHHKDIEAKILEEFYTE